MINKHENPMTEVFLMYYQAALQPFIIMYKEKTRSFLS